MTVEQPTSAPPGRPDGQIRALYGIFLVSGFCGLIYESIWSHYLKLLLGHAAYAQAVVLVVFVGGLALGAWLTGRWSDRIRQPLVAYAAAEAAVAVGAFAFHGVFVKAAAWANTQLIPAWCTAGEVCMASWLLAAALILPAAILLGATFPLMSAGVLRLGASAGRSLSQLYFLNSAGAAGGVLASGFVFIPTFGLTGTLLLAGSMNALVALAAYSVSRSSQAVPAPLEPATLGPAQAPAPAARLLLAVALLTGLSSFIYEVAWIRMLSLVLGAATHSFELMLASFILGLALGARWIRSRIDGNPAPQRLLGIVQVAMGILAVATLPLYVGSFDAMAWLLRGVDRTGEGYALFLSGSALLSMVVMLPAAFCAGMTLPLITTLLLRNGGERRVGQVYGVNTLGAILGVLAAVHVLIPVLGLKWTLAVGAAIDLALGAVLLLPRPGPSREVGPAPSFPAMPALAVCAAVLVAVTALTPLAPRMLSSGVFRSGKAELAADHTIRFHRDGKTATVTVVEQANGQRSIYTNGKSDGATHPQGKTVTPDDHTVVLLGALGPAHHPAARRAAVIGLGTGVTSSVLLQSPAIESVDTIEIEPMMVEAAAWFRPKNAPVLDDPRSRIVVDDARAHFAKSGVYDLIVSEPSNPWVSGVAGLFTAEFYRHVSQHLAPDGHFVQWLQVYEASPKMVASVLKAFASVFPEYRVYITNAADVILVARRDRTLPELSLAAVDRMDGIKARLLDIGIDSGTVLRAHDAGTSRTVGLLFEGHGAPVNSDYAPFVDHQAPRDRFQKSGAAPLFQLNLAPVPLHEFAAPRDPVAGTGASGASTAVTAPTAHMPRKLHDLASAWHGRRYLLGEELSPRETGYLGAFADDYALVRGWIANCAFPARPGPHGSALVLVAGDLNPGLAPDTARQFWEEILRRCGARLDPATARWLRLFAAVGARDAQGASELALELLQAQAPVALEQREYLVLAAVGGLLAQRQPSQALKTFMAHGKEIPSDRVDIPWFRYVTLQLRGLGSPAAQPAR